MKVIFENKDGKQTSIIEIEKDGGKSIYMEMPLELLRLEDFTSLHPIPNAGIRRFDYSETIYIFKEVL
jgi:hypothetical protein